MRISDWSSDVCSSDLRNRRGGGPALTPAVGAHRHHQRVAVDANLDLIDQLALALGPRAGRPADRQPNLERAADAHAIEAPDRVAALGRLAGRGSGEEDQGKIGRASCRVRVCQDVKISVAAGSHTKKNINTTNDK